MRTTIVYGTTRDVTILSQEDDLSQFYCLFVKYDWVILYQNFLLKINTEFVVCVNWLILST